MKEENTEELVGRRLKAYEKIIENRRYQISILYGAEAAKKYTHIRDEKDYFGWHGHLPEAAPYKLWAESNTARERTKRHHADFFEFCDRAYAVQKQLYFDRIAQRKKENEALPIWQKQSKEREVFEEFLARLGQKWSQPSTAGSPSGFEARTPTTPDACPASRAE